MVEPLLLAPLALVAGGWLTVIALSQPRKLLYLAIALSPTQFLFFPVSSFFLSPADVLVASSLAGLLLRLTSLQPAAWRALHQHRFLVLMICSYAIGFVVLGVFSRTLIRLPLGIALSVLACELLHTRKQLLHAVTAIVLAGVLDAGYGVFLIARGTPGYPSRFSGMSSVNISGMVIAAAAVAALATLARTRRPLTLVGPGILGGFALATLSQMAFLALLGSWFAVLRQFLSRANRTRIVSACVVVVAIALNVSPVRERVLSRDARVPESDGVARNTADVRWMIMWTAWNGFLMSPVLGLGYNKFLEYSRTNPTIYVSTGGEGYYTHNSALEVIVEGGLVAFTLFLLHWWQYLRGISHSIREAMRAHDTLAAACLVGVPVVVVCLILSNVLLLYSFWSISGVALACLTMLRREARHPEVLRFQEQPLLG
jgi:hypothetical protein